MFLPFNPVTLCVTENDPEQGGWNHDGLFASPYVLLWLLFGSFYACRT